MRVARGHQAKQLPGRLPGACLVIKELDIGQQPFAGGCDIAATVVFHAS